LLIAQLSIQHVLTYLLQVSLSQPQVDCIASYLRASAAAQPLSSSSPAPRPPSSSLLPCSPLAQRYSPGFSNASSFAHAAVPAALPSDDEDLVSEFTSLLSRAGLAPPSSRRPVAAMLCAAGIGSAEALLLALDRDPSFLYNQVATC
jgi:hypothetical protein